MGFLDWIGVGGSPEQQIARQLKRIKQAYAQPDYRRAAMDALLKMGTPEAYGALCKRFGAVANSAYWDEEEKKWLVDTFVELGQAAVGALKDYVIQQDYVNYPVRALERILPPEALVGFLVEALHSRAPDDYRRDKGKLELIDHLGKRDPSAHLLQAIEPYLHDHSDDVICKTVEVIEDWKATDLGPQLLALVFDEGMSARVQRRAAEAVVELGVQAQGELAPLPDAVAEDFEIKGATLARRRPKGAEE